MDQIVFEDEDFSADEDVCDPNYVPTKVIRNIVSESEPAVSAKRMRSTRRSPKLIFNPEFYVAMVMYTNGSTTAKCAACHKLIKGTGEVTSNFISHLKVRHSELHKKYMRMKAGPSDGSTSQEAFGKKIIRFLVDCALPVSVVEKESFRDLFSGTGLKVMCQKTAMKRLNETYNSMVTAVQTAMSSSKYFCTTADIWSGNHRSFLGYTCHWLDQNFERKSAALACKRILGVHSGEKIAQMIGDMNTFFGLNTTNIIMTITDNGSNFVKAFRDHGLRQSGYDGKEAEEESEDEIPIFENDKYLPKHERCASHTLNLLATTDFQRILQEQPALHIQHTMTIKKCHQLWKKCKWPKSSEVIQSLLGSALVVPVVTRWNSLYDAIVKLLQFKVKLNELADELTLPPFSGGDFQSLESYKMLMEPIAQTLDFLQGAANVKYGCIIPTLLSLSNKLLKLSRKPEVLGDISSIAVQLEQQLRVRFKLYFTLAPEVNMAIAAAVLTPDVKMKWLRVIQKTSPDCTEEQISKRVIEVICTFFKNGFSYSATDVPNFNNGNSFYDFDDDATSHADVITKFDITSPQQYTSNSASSGDSDNSGDSSSSVGNGGSLSINSNSKLASSYSSSPSSSLLSSSSSLTSSSSTAAFTPSASSALASVVQAEAPSLETFVSAASTSAFVEPYLDGYATTNVTAQIGTHAYLPCRVKQLGNKSVSWIRVRDGHILTVDRAVFIADQRFLALKQPDKFWTLQIKYVQARDAGAYECQVSTEPKVSARVHLQVVVPRTEILGDPDRYVKAGSTVILRCIVRGALEPPTFIMWYHGSEQLSAESRRHKTQVDRNSPEVEGDSHSTIGSLIIDSVKKRDTGNYTCSPSNSPSVTVTLNVINGESSASAVTSSASVTTKTYSACSLVLILSVIMIGGHRT